jgi:hypothetical protein
MKKIIRLTESDLTRIVKRVLMEQTSSMVDDVKKFGKDNGFLIRNNDSTFYKTNDKFEIYIKTDSGSTVDLCVSNIKNKMSCDVFDTMYNNNNWNLSTFESTVKKYMV